MLISRRINSVKNPRHSDKGLEIVRQASRHHNALKRIDYASFDDEISHDVCTVCTYFNNKFRGKFVTFREKTLKITHQPPPQPVVWSRLLYNRNLGPEHFVNTSRRVLAIEKIILGPEYLAHASRRVRAQQNNIMAPGCFAYPFHQRAVALGNQLWVHDILHMLPVEFVFLGNKLWAQNT